MATDKQKVLGFLAGVAVRDHISNNDITTAWARSLYPEYSHHCKETEQVWFEGPAPRFTEKDTYAIQVIVANERSLKKSFQPKPSLREKIMRAGYGHDPELARDASLWCAAVATMGVDVELTTPGRKQRFLELAGRAFGQAIEDAMRARGGRDDDD